MGESRNAGEANRVANEGRGGFVRVGTYEEWFEGATGFPPYPFQIRVAEREPFPSFLSLPTGVGKTEAVVLAWLWRRRFSPDSVLSSRTPRRLVYCLPARVLVEQTRDRVTHMLARLHLEDEVLVHVIMGGEETDDWSSFPERETILVGTQDMLLSRALNRGYGASRFRWPREFGLLNNDCLWVFDEIQLMGPGLHTSAQLAAFRERFGAYGGCPSIWMSATLDTSWLRTADFAPREEPFRLGTQDAHSSLRKRIRAKKTVRKGDPTLSRGAQAHRGYALGVAEEVGKRHLPQSLTMVLLNTVDRARLVYRSLRRLSKPGGPDLRLIHSRFRAPDRASWASFLSRDAEVPPQGRIVVSTQVVEAGVDISARTLLTELAPWSSIVQRLGRCNRDGVFSDSVVVWFDLDEEHAAPYEGDDLKETRAKLLDLEGRDASPEALSAMGAGTVPEPKHLLRHRDLIDLFDTTPDLSGHDLDVSRFVREVEDSDALVFWRNLAGKPSPEEPAPGWDELCPAPLSEVRSLLQRTEGWVWDPLSEDWRRLRQNDLRPTTEVMVPSSAGGYTRETGWDPSLRDAVPLPMLLEGTSAQGLSGDPDTEQGYWQTLGAHSRRVHDVCGNLLTHLTNIGLSEEVGRAARLAARFHDLGKAHEVFQRTLMRGLPDAERQRRSTVLWAKAKRPVGKHERPYFRHELAGALALLTTNQFTDGLPPSLGDLVIYLVAAHHGKVRLSLRSLPSEVRPPNGGRYARGIWEGDHLPQSDLGDGVSVPEVVLDLSSMELGQDAQGQPSWIARMTALRDDKTLGPFRIAFLEGLVRAADIRASRDPGPEVDNHGIV